MNVNGKLKIKNDSIDSYSLKIKVPDELKKDKVVICDYVEYNDCEEDNNKHLLCRTLLDSSLNSINDESFNNTIKN